jgi:hypothetical protein
VSVNRPRLRRVLAATTVLLAITLVAGCSDDSDPEPDADKAKDTPSETTGTPTTPVDPATDPNGPFVVAATAVAQRSVDQVIQLHVMGTGTVDLNALRDQIPTLAEAIATELGNQIADATMMTPPKDSVAAELVDALTDYQELAGQLSEWNAEQGQPMPDGWFDRLEKADRHWKGALRKLGDLSGTDLLANVPELILPT